MTGPGFLVSDELAVAFDAGADTSLDAHVLVADGDAVQALQNSVAVYRGELLPGFYEDWVSPERERLDGLFQSKMQRLLDRLAVERRWTDVVEWANRWISLGHATRARLPGADAGVRRIAGNRSGMAQAYQHCRKALFNDLGVEPSLQTQRLFARLAVGDVESVDVKSDIGGELDRDAGLRDQGRCHRPTDQPGACGAKRSAAPTTCSCASTTPQAQLSS